MPTTEQRDLYRVLRAIRQRTDAILVSYSGGKDSAVVLDLVMRPEVEFRRVVAFHMERFPGLSWIEQTLAAVEARYGIEVMRVPHWEMAGFFQRGIFTFEDASIPSLTIKDVETYVRAKTGIDWIASGEKRADSLWRMGILSSTTQGTYLDPVRRRAYVIGEWDVEEVRAYVTKQKLPLTVGSGIRGDLTSMDPEAASLCREKFPKDFARMRLVLPLLDALAHRGDVMRAERARRDAAKQSAKAERQAAKAAAVAAEREAKAAAKAAKRAETFAQRDAARAERRARRKADRLAKKLVKAAKATTPVED